jgi:hypothetical protein
MSIITDKNKIVIKTEVITSEKFLQYLRDYEEIEIGEKSVINDICINNYEIPTTKKGINSRITISDSEFAGDFCIDGSERYDKIIIFFKDISFNNTTFSGRIIIKNCRADMSNPAITPIFEFKNCTFKKKIDISQSVFGHFTLEDIPLKKTTENSNENLPEKKHEINHVIFQDVIIHKNANFQGDHFRKQFHLIRCDVGEIAYFCGAKFDDIVNFDESTFRMDVFFKEDKNYERCPEPCSLHGISSQIRIDDKCCPPFEDHICPIYISKKIDEGKASERIIQYCRLYRIFCKRIIDDRESKDNVHFCKFEKRVLIQNVTFHQRVLFDNAVFSNRLFLPESKFHNTLSLNNTKFSNPKDKEIAYRIAKKTAEDSGKYEDAAENYSCEMQAIREQKNKVMRYVEFWLFERAFGYGVKSERIFFSWLFIILAFALVFTGIATYNQGFGNLINDFGFWFIFSLMKSTVPEFNLILNPPQPIGIIELLVYLEALIGLFFWAGIIATISKRFLNG